MFDKNGDSTGGGMLGKRIKRQTEWPFREPVAQGVVLVVLNDFSDGPRGSVKSVPQ